MSITITKHEAMDALRTADLRPGRFAHGNKWKVCPVCAVGAIVRAALLDSKINVSRSYFGAICSVNLGRLSNFFEECDGDRDATLQWADENLKDDITIALLAVT